MTSGIPAPHDPFLLEAQRVVDAIPGIRITHFLGRLNDTLFFAQYMITSFRKLGRPHMVNTMISGLPEMLALLPFNDDVQQSDRDKAIADLMRKWNVTAQENANRCEHWILNHGLISLCTVFDGFIEHVVEVMFRWRLELLYGLGDTKNITLQEIVTLGSTDAIVAHFCEKEVKRLGFKEINKRIEYLTTRMQLDAARIFHWSSCDPELDGTEAVNVPETLRS